MEKFLFTIYLRDFWCSLAFILNQDAFLLLLWVSREGFITHSLESISREVGGDAEHLIKLMQIPILCNHRCPATEYSVSCFKCVCLLSLASCRLLHLSEFQILTHVFSRDQDVFKLLASKNTTLIAEVYVWNNTDRFFFYSSFWFILWVKKEDSLLSPRKAIFYVWCSSLKCKWESSAFLFTVGK